MTGKANHALKKICIINNAIPRPVGWGTAERDVNGVTIPWGGVCADTRTARNYAVGYLVQASATGPWRLYQRSDFGVKGRLIREIGSKIDLTELTTTKYGLSTIFIVKPEFFYG